MYHKILSAHYLLQGIHHDLYLNQLKLYFYTSILLKLNFANNTILSCFFFLIMGLYFLIPAVIILIFNIISELVIPIGIPTKEQKVEMETHPVIVEVTISKWSI